MPIHFIQTALLNHNLEGVRNLYGVLRVRFLPVVAAKAVLNVFHLVANITK